MISTEIGSHDCYIIEQGARVPLYDFLLSLQFSKLQEPSMFIQLKLNAFLLQEMRAMPKQTQSC